MGTEHIAPMGTIAVVIPTFNRPQLLRETVCSVLAQSRAPSEIIVVNDGGPIDPSECLADLLPDVRLRVLTKANGGTASARNFGAASTAADYILFLDDDDQLVPDALELLGSRLDEGVWVAAAGGAEIMGRPPGEELWWIPVDVPGGDYFETALDSCPFPASAVLMRREVLRDIGGYRAHIRSIDDYDLWIRLTSAGKIATVQRPVLLYRIHDGNLSKAPIQLEFARDVALEATRLAPTAGREAGVRVRRYLMKAHLDDLFWSVRGDLRSGNIGGALKGVALSLTPVLSPTMSFSVLRSWVTIATKNLLWRPNTSTPVKDPLRR